MANNQTVVNSESSLVAFNVQAKQLWDKHKYVTFSFRVGEDRSIDQNALLHVWGREYAAHLLDKDKKLVTKGELAGMKRHMKRMCYLGNGWGFLVHQVVNPADTEQRKLDFTSSEDWKRGEMFDFLSWVQMKAAGDGLILESKGEFNKLQREQTA